MCIKKKKETEGESIDIEILKGLATRAENVARTIKTNNNKHQKLEKMLSTLTEKKPVDAKSDS